MSISRRDFMKVFGVSVASLILARCKQPATPQPTETPTLTCYTATPIPPTPEFTPLPTSLPARERLRLCWLRFNELAQATTADYEKGDSLSQQLVADHRVMLDVLVAAGELPASVADLVQEAYTAAVYHIWRSNAPMTCYAPVIVDYAPVSAGVLVQQAEALSQVSGDIDPETLAKAQAALEHDMAFYALSDADVQALYDRLTAEWQENGQTVPSFEALELELTPDAKAAAQFIMDLLTGK